MCQAMSHKHWLRKHDRKLLSHIGQAHLLVCEGLGPCSGPTLLLDSKELVVWFQGVAEVQGSSDLHPKDRDIYLTYTLHRIILRNKGNVLLENTFESI